MTTKTKTIKRVFAAVIAAVMALCAFAALVACTNADDENTAYIVAFDTHLGTSVPPQKVKSGEKVEKPADPVRPGYEFGGWYTSVKYETAWDFSADKVTADITLHAKWTENPDDTDDPDKPKTFTVAFDSHYGTSVAPQQVVSGGKATAPENPARIGYKFEGWYTTAGYKTEWNFDTDTVTDHMTLHAMWTKIDDTDIPDDPDEPKTYTVLFDSHFGTSVASQQIVSGGKVNRPADPTRVGYAFKGWFKTEGGADEWDFGTDTVTGDTVLHAKWEADEQPPATGDVTVTFNVGYAARKSGLSNPPVKTVKSGSKVKEPASVQWKGMTLAGWYKEGGSKKWNFASDAVTNDMTLFARWSNGTVLPTEYAPSADMNSAGHVYLHYYRPDGSYDDFTAYCWNNSAGKSKNFEIMKVDGSGAVFDVTLSDIGVSAATDTALNFIITRPNWDKDGGDNLAAFAKMSQSSAGAYHWYIEQGKTANGKNEFTMSTPPISGGEIMYETEPKRESAHNVDRSFAQSLSVMNTAENTDDMGVGYQIFVASFCDSDGDGMGDIRGIINKLDYLQSLNVDVLWLTPVQTSNSYHGYDCYDYYSIDPKFGTDADYRELVYKAHGKGMKIIMDLVVNHTSPNNEWFIKSKEGAVETVTYTDGTQKEIHYRDFYRWKSTSESGRWYSSGDGWYFYSSFGSGMPELNYDCQEARDSMADVAMYWMAYGLDGFRMDAIKHMFMWDESDHTGDVEGRPEEASTGYNFNLTKDVEWFREFNYRLKTKYPDCFLLGENLTGDVRYVAPFYAGMDSLFDFNTYYDLPGGIAAGNVSKAATALNDNAAQYEKCREGAGRAINSMITSNHDIERLAYRCGGNADRQKLYFAVMMTMPGLSWIYYGDEIGMYSEKVDGNGDIVARQPMKWTGDWQNKALPSDVPNKHYDDALASVAEQSDDENSMLSYVRALTAVRNEYPALIHGTATCSEYNGMLKIVVTDGKQTVTAYHNFTADGKTVSEGGDMVFGSQNVKAYGTAVFVS